ncbi:hypothetical protein B0T13DRAFT_448860 [Neurospora crassa]|nr:hypothetical protein B0T13DRAFT_448860 [Neurospora crassa]
MVVEERFRVMVGNSDVKSVASDTTAWARDGTSEASTAVKEATSGTGTDTSELRIDCRDSRSSRADGMFVLNMGISGVVSELRSGMLAAGRGTLGTMALKIEAISGVGSGTVDTDTGTEASSDESSTVRVAGRGREANSDTTIAESDWSSEIETGSSELTIDWNDCKSSRTDGRSVLNRGIKGVISDMRSGMSDVGTAAVGKMALKLETTPGVGFTLVGTGNESGSDNPGLRNGGWPEEVGPGTGIIGGKVPSADIVMSCCTPG